MPQEPAPQIIYVVKEPEQPRRNGGCCGCLTLLLVLGFVLMVAWPLLSLLTLLLPQKAGH